MPENEFEKRVQQQMGELQMHPSDEVWTQVEKELKEKKKRRVIFFLFMFAGFVLLGYTGYLLSGNQAKTLAVKQNQSPAQTVETTTTIKNNTTSNSSVPEIATTPVSNDQAAGSTTQTITTIDQSIKLPATILQDNSLNVTTKKQTAKKNKADISPHLAAQQGRGEEFNIDISAPAVGQNKPVSNKPAIETRTTTEAAAIVITQKALAQPQQPVPDSLSAKLTGKDSVATASVTVPEETPATPAKKKKSYPRIKWGADLSVGKASSRENRFLFSSPVQPSGSYASPTPGNGNPQPGLTLQPPSDVKPGLAYKAGVAVEIKFSKRSTVISGLRYSQLREKIKVGNVVDLVNVNVSNQLNTYLGYRGIAQKSYTNTYHFIELPLLYQLQLNKSKKLPVLWNIGTSLSYLVSTNALVYDTTAGGVYFSDKKVFNKFHLGVQSGFSLQFGNENKIHWTIGPEVSLDLSRQLKQDKFQDKKYLMYGGITGRLYFGQIKK